MNCQRKPHYGEPCDCEERLAAVTTHTSKPIAFGPDYCDECSAAIQEWVVWPCEGVLKVKQEALETIAASLCSAYWHSCILGPCEDTLKQAQELVEAATRV